ncbi:hypothetical protein L6R52_20745 [Myxococcota bacterium]|nr:hypothetical protein [Myxococcota bacterium]
MVFIGGGRSLGTTINDFLGVFGVKGAGVGLAVDSLTGNSVGQLANLHDMYLETALGRGSGPIERLMGGMGMGMIPPFLGMPSPMAAFPTMMPLCGAGYAGGLQTIDLAAGSSNIPFFSKLFNPQRRAAGQFERMLRNNPYARAAFEAQIGGRIVDFGFRKDGVMTIQRFAPGFTPVPGMALNPLANTALGCMAGMDASILGRAAFMGAGSFGLGALYGGNPFGGFMVGGLQSMMGSGASATVGIGSPNGVWGFSGLQSSLGGQGVGSWNPQAQPGQINNTNPMYERAHQAEIDNVLRDPSLTVEDKVTLMIMLIMKKMDADIERQAQYINSIQQQQSNRGDTGGAGGGGKGGKGGVGKGGMVGGQAGAPGGTNNGSPSIDVETMKLKRMIDKRSQMFDMLRQIIDKYNQTAKGIIDSIGR